MDQDKKEEEKFSQKWGMRRYENSLFEEFTKKSKERLITVASSNNVNLRINSKITKCRMRK